MHTGILRYDDRQFSFNIFTKKIWHALSGKWSTWPFSRLAASIACFRGEQNWATHSLWWFSNSWNKILKKVKFEKGASRKCQMSAVCLKRIPFEPRTPSGLGASFSSVTLIISGMSLLMGTRYSWRYVLQEIKLQNYDLNWMMLCKWFYNIMQKI